MVSVYGIKNCDSVKKALKFFDAQGIPYTFTDFKTTPVDAEKIAEWSQKSDLSTLFNSKSTTYRTLNLKSIITDDSLKVQWMAKENLLIKRPVIEYNSNVIVGFNLSLYEGTFLS
ncbi:MAG TPA: Spx/MgsR family RNA polymerase-binding regulatory protein [Sulfuricurvum sp.]|nr:Spx/MgsR family RNA polymerase-binding regulatory protein [Sulfuricurvum sp.]